MLSKSSAKNKLSGHKHSPPINYNLTEQSLQFTHNIPDPASNGYLNLQPSLSSYKQTNHTDISTTIKCKKLNNKEITLRTEPYQQQKKIQDIQDKYISARNKSRKAEQDSGGQNVSHTNRNSKKHQHIATEVFNNTGKLSYLTEGRYKYMEDVVALQSKTTTRKTRRQSQANNTLHQSQGHSRIPSFQLKSPKKSMQKLVKKSKSDKKQLISKTLALNVEIKKSKTENKKLKPTIRLELNKIQKKVLDQVLELSSFSYGQHSKSEPDLYHRFVETEEVSFDKSDKDKAVNMIKRCWKIYKKNHIQEMYKRIFNKNSRNPLIPPPINFNETKVIKKVPSFQLRMFQNTSKQMTISANDDLDFQFNVNKYVNVNQSPQPQESQEDIGRIKKRNRKLEKQLLKFKEKQLDLCEKFQSILMAPNSQNINAQELIKLIQMYKTEAVLDKKSSTSSIVSYKELIQEKGIAQKIANSKNPLLKSLLDDEESFLRHKTSSKSMNDDHSSLSVSDHKQPTFSPEAKDEQERVAADLSTKQLLSTYLDCELGNIAYQKPTQNDRDLIKQSIDNEIQQFSNEQRIQKDKQITREMVLQLTKSQEFHSSILNSLCLQFCEEIQKSPSMVQNIHYLKEIEGYNKSLQIKVSLPDIIDYLKGLIEHIMKSKATISMALENINKPLGSTSAELLYYLRANFDDQSSYSHNPYQFIVPMKLFEELENVNRSIDTTDSQEGVMIHYFWHRALYELFNELLDKRRPYGLRGKPYAWSKNISTHTTPVTLQKMTKIFQNVLNEILQILTFPTGLMFDSPLCQYYQCDLSQDDKMKINQDRMWLIICEEVMEQEPHYHSFDDQVAQVEIFLAEYIQDLIFFEAVVDTRKLQRQRFLLSI